MKKNIAGFLVLTVIFCLIAVTAGYSSDEIVPIYAPDGRKALVLDEETDAYYKVGWYPAPVRTLYSADQRNFVVYESEVESYLNLGWYQSPVSVLYSAEGKELVVYKSDVDAYLNVGWHTVPVTRIYATDGRQLVVAIDDVEAYLNLGWYDKIDSVSKIMVSPGGVEERIYADYYSYYFSLGYILKGGRPIDPSKPMIALTFDDGPSEYTNQILDCLQLNKSEATFFCVGNNVARHADITKRAFDAKMEIGNHTYSHPNLSKTRHNAAMEQISTASAEIVLATGGYKPKLFRPPYGNTTQKIRDVVDMPLILWSIDTRDWETRDVQSTVNSVVNNAKDGDIILMHDIYPQTADAVDIIVPALIEKGFQLVTVSELATYKNTSLINGQKYHSIR